MRSDRSAAVKTDYDSERMFAIELDNLRFVGFSKDTMNENFRSSPGCGTLRSFDSRDVATNGCCPGVDVFDLRVFEQLFDNFFNWTLAYQLPVYHHAVRLIASECNRLASS